MYKPGGRPNDLVKTEVAAENVEPQAETPQDKSLVEESKTETLDATTATQTSDTISGESS